MTESWVNLHFVRHSSRYNWLLVPGCPLQRTHLLFDHVWSILKAFECWLIYLGFHSTANRCVGFLNGLKPWTFFLKSFATSMGSTLRPDKVRSLFRVFLFRFLVFNVEKWANFLVVVYDIQCFLLLSGEPLQTDLIVDHRLYVVSSVTTASWRLDLKLPVNYKFFLNN